MVINDNGPVTNNDIEMVILAFETGKRQNYQIEGTIDIIQKVFGNSNISEALGKGN